MSDKLKYSIDNKKVHNQFENELFFKYLGKYFSKINIKYSNKFQEKFYDKNTNTLILPKNPTKKQFESIINFLEKITKYDLGITAKKRLENLKTHYKINKEIQNEVLIEALYENGKKQVLENMQAPNSNILLKDLLKLDELSKNFNKLPLSKQKKEIEKILRILGEYSSANISKNNGGFPMIFLKNKKLYCIGYNYLADIIFEKLGVKHFIASGLILDGKLKRPHSISVIKLKNNYYIFDSSFNLFLNKIYLKNNIGFKIIGKNKFYNGYYFSLGNPEKELIAQNLRNISLDTYNIQEKVKILNYALNFSPNNIVILKDLEKIYIEINNYKKLKIIKSKINFILGKINKN